MNKENSFSLGFNFVLGMVTAVLVIIILFFILIFVGVSLSPILVFVKNNWKLIILGLVISLPILYAFFKVIGRIK